MTIEERIARLEEAVLSFDSQGEESEEGFLYFSVGGPGVKKNNGEGKIKTGFSIDPPSRCKANNTVFLLQFPGTRADEDVLQAFLAPFAIPYITVGGEESWSTGNGRKEWFYPSEEVMFLMAAMGRGFTLTEAIQATESRYRKARVA